MESIQELLRKLCKCIVKSDDGLDYITISKQETPTPPTPPEPEKPDLDKFDPNVPFCIENVGDEPVFLCVYNWRQNYAPRSYCEISYDNKTWKPYELKNSTNYHPTDISQINIIALNNKGDRVYFKMDDYVYTSSSYGNNTLFYFLNDNQGIKVRARGNIASLNYGRDDLYKTKYLEIDDAHKYCFNEMFRGCASLVQAPDLPATTLAEGCYKSMFYDCTKLDNLKCSATVSNMTTFTSNWLLNVATIGTFTCNNKKYFEIDSASGIPKGWSITETEPDVFDTSIPFYIENVGDTPVRVGMYDHSANKAVRSDCKFSYDNITWEDFNLIATENASTSSNITTVLLSNKGDRVYFKADNYVFDSASYTHIVTYTQNAKIRAGGNIMSLNHGNNDAYKTDYMTVSGTACFRQLFDGLTTLVQGPELPATKLSTSCYWQMFKGCSSLKLVSDLPATTIASKCYYYMFENCTTLTRVPKLPAAVLKSSCYKGMFHGCTSLIQAPDLPAIKLANECCLKMFRGCTSLIYAPDELPATTLAPLCYAQMFDGCTSLTHSPGLPALKLADKCYQGMFQDCKALTHIPKILPATTLNTLCYSYMFNGCESLTQSPELPATVLVDGCYSYMFQGCKALTQTPELPATTLVDRCYKYMFQDCPKATYIKCLATDISATDCTNYWVNKIATTGDFYTPAATNWETDSIHGIPRYWTRHDIT